MLIRTIPLRQKDCMIINDVPVKAEVQRGDKFSAISNMNMLTAFRKGTLDIYSKTTEAELPRITYKDIYTTYLDYTYYGDEALEKNFDFCKEFKKRKDLIEDHDNGCLVERDYPDRFFVQLEHQKDVYVSARLYTEFKALLEEINACQPKLIICTGKWSLFFLTGCTTLTQNMSTYKDKKPFGGLAKFRSSILKIHECYDVAMEHILVPMYHTVSSITMPDKAYIMDMDIQKICHMFSNIKTEGVEYYIKPDKDYIIGDTKEKIFSYLEVLLEILDKTPTLVSIDIETFFMSTIDCIGFAYEVNRGLCIPFASKDKSALWYVEDEIAILCLVRKVLLHKNCLHVGQNYSYDCQYYYKLWGITVYPEHDTMILHHLLYNKLPKDLAFLASLYCEWYSYWKGEVDGTKENPETRWIYNAKDVCYTLEVLLNLLDILEATGDKELEKLYRFQVKELLPETVKTMNRGIKVNKKMKEELYHFFKDMLNKVPDAINKLLGFEFNNNSTPQKKKLFKEYFGITLKEVKKKGVGFVETCDAKAMLAYMDEYALLKPFLGALLEFSALSKFTSTFLGMKLDSDDRARTQYKITGTAFGRLSSVKNVWGGGGNFQNLPEKGKVPIFLLSQLLELDCIDLEPTDWTELEDNLILEELYE